MPECSATKQPSSPLRRVTCAALLATGNRQLNCACVLLRGLRDGKETPPPPVRGLTRSSCLTASPCLARVGVLVTGSRTGRTVRLRICSCPARLMGGVSFLALFLLRFVSDTSARGGLSLHVQTLQTWSRPQELRGKCEGAWATSPTSRIPTQIGTGTLVGSVSCVPNRPRGGKPG